VECGRKARVLEHAEVKVADRQIMGEVLNSIIRISKLLEKRGLIKRYEEEH